MFRLKLAILAIVIGGAAVAVAGQAAKPAAAPAQAPPAAPAKYMPPVRGVADIGYTKPETKVIKDEVVTTIKVKNLSVGPVAGLKVEEFWWDKAGNPVTGSVDRLKKPLQPGEVATITLRTPKNPKMDRNNYNFTHANGAVKTKLLKTLS